MENFLLSSAQCNKTYTIASMCNNIDIKIKTRLLELGFFVSEKICVLKKSMAKEVFLIEIRGQVLTLRKQEAACVVING